MAGGAERSARDWRTARRPRPAATTSTAAERDEARPPGADADAGSHWAGARSASANSRASANRSSGSLPSARSIASAAGGGTSGRSSRTGARPHGAMLREDLPRRLAEKRRRPREHLVHHAAERVHVGAAVEGVAGGLLGAHVDRRADDEPGAGDPLVRGGADRAGDAEVGDDRVARQEQHVAGLDVAVDDVEVVRVGERVGDLAGDRQRLLHRQRADPVELLPERLALDVGHDVVQDAGVLARVVDRQDVGMGQAGGDLDLAEEPLGAEREGDVGPQDLDRDPPPLPQVLGDEDGGHPAASDLAVDDVAAAQHGSGNHELVHDAQHMRRAGREPDGDPRALRRSRP